VAESVSSSRRRRRRHRGGRERLLDHAQHLRAAALLRKGAALNAIQIAELLLGANDA
jgi:hypothetical protein